MKSLSIIAIVILAGLLLTLGALFIWREWVWRIRQRQWNKLVDDLQQNQIKLGTKISGLSEGMKRRGLDPSLFVLLLLLGFLTGCAVPDVQARRPADIAAILPSMPQAKAVTQTFADTSATTPSPQLLTVSSPVPATIESSTNLLSWQPLALNSTSLVVSVMEPALFFRGRVQHAMMRFAIDGGIPSEAAGLRFWNGPQSNGYTETFDVALPQPAPSSGEFTAGPMTVYPTNHYTVQCYNDTGASDRLPDVERQFVFNLKIARQP